MKFTPVPRTELGTLEIGGRTFRVIVSPELPIDTIAVADEVALKQLQAGIEFEREDALTSPTTETTETIETSAAAGGTVGQFKLGLPAEVYDRALVGGRTGKPMTFAKFQQLGATRDQLQAALRHKGNLLSPMQRNILSQSIAGRSSQQIAQDAGMSAGAVNRARRSAAIALGFTPKEYPTKATATKQGAAALPVGAAYDNNGVREN